MDKKILLLNYEFPPIWGWGWVASYYLAKWWQELWYKVIVITWWYQWIQNFEDNSWIEIYRVNKIFRWNKSTAWFIYLFTFIFFWTLKWIELCIKNKFCFINTHFVLPTWPIGFVLSKIFAIKNILSIHWWDIYDPSKKSSPHNFYIFKKIINFLFAKADIIIAQSNDTKNNAIKYYWQHDIKIIPLPFRNLYAKWIWREEIWMKKDIFYLITIWRLIKRKGFDLFIEIINSINIDNIHWIIIWNGPENNNLSNLINKYNLHHKIIINTDVSNDIDKMNLLSNSDCFISTSLHEWFWIVFQEAMSVWIPIVATNNWGQNDFLVSGKNSLICSYDNKNEFISKITELYNNKILREKFSKNNLKIIKQFDINIIAKKYLDLL